MRSSKQESPIRVLVVAHGPPLSGGITTVALDLVNSPALNAQFDIVFQNTSQAQDKRGVLALENVLRALGHAATTFRLARRRTIVHTHSVQDPTLVAWRQVLIAAAARLRGARVVLHNHAFRPYMEPPGGYQIGVAHRIAFRLLDYLAHANVLLSPEGLANLEPLMPHTPMPVVPNSVIVSDVGRSSVDHKPAVLLFVGELLERKGVLTLLDALDLLAARETPEWRMVIVGDNRIGLDPEKDRIVNEVRRRGHGPTMTGPVPREDVYRHLADSDIFAFPSFVEGQPFSIIEALAAGVPIIASDIPTVADMVTDGVEGLLVQVRDPKALADGIEKLLCDVDLRQAIGARGHERAVANYDRRVFEDRIAQIYRTYAR